MNKQELLMLTFLGENGWRRPVFKDQYGQF